jgi:LacI family transcriptional regulator
MSEEAGNELLRPRRITMREVADTAGVSLGTVSRVVNANRSVRESVRKRVLDAMDSLGYVPNAVAQSMRMQATMAVGCMVSEVSNPLFAMAVSAAEKVFLDAGYTMVLTNSRDSGEREIEALSLFLRRRLDGLICTVSDEENKELISTLKKIRMPVVLLERQLSIACDWVTTDHYAGVYQATSYLLTLEHRDIALITVTQKALPGRERARAFAKAFADRGLRRNDELTAYHGFSADYGYSAAYNFLTSENPPTAIIAGANQMVGVLKVVRMLNLRVPEDLSIICIGDTDLAELFSPPLTVVRWDIPRVGAAAAEILISRLNGKSRQSPVQMTIPAELVLRGSCCPPRGR